MRLIKGKDGVWRREGPRPVDEPEIAGQEGARVRSINRVMATIARNLAANPLPRRAPLGVTCDECGCLNRRGDPCIGCLAVEASWRVAA